MTAERKRVAIVIPNLGGGGAERVALTLAQGFLERGHEVDLVLMQKAGELLDAVPDGARIFDLGAPRGRNAILPLARYLRERRPDSVQVSMWPLTVIAVAARLLARSRSRLVLSDHSTLSQQYGRKPAAMAAIRATTRLAYPLADARVCVSQGCADDLARLSGLPVDRFKVIFNPVSVSNSGEGEARWPATGCRILNVGSMNPVKNQELLIRAFARFGRERPAQLTILGEGVLRPRLEQLARELGVAERVGMPGFAIDPSPWYASADLFVLSSDYEGLGNVLVEALHFGLPVVSTDCPSGPREILDGGRFGRLVPPGDEHGLAQAMADVLKAPHDPEAAKDRARELSRDSFRRYEELMVG